MRSPGNVVVGRTLDWMYGELNGQDPSVWNVGTSRPIRLGSDWLRNGQTDGQTNGRTPRQTDKQTDRLQIRQLDGWTNKRKDRQTDISDALSALIEGGLLKSMNCHVCECKTNQSTRCFCAECGSVTSCQCCKGTMWELCSISGHRCNLEPLWKYVSAL